MSDITDFSTHGQQLLAGSKYSASGIARLLNVPRQRVSDWRRGKACTTSSKRTDAGHAAGVQVISFAESRSGGEEGQDVTGCVLAGPSGNGLQGLYDVVKAY